MHCVLCIILNIYEDAGVRIGNIMNVQLILSFLLCRFLCLLQMDAWRHSILSGRTQILDHICWSQLMQRHRIFRYKFKINPTGLYRLEW